jgi:hypothetical protein
MLEWVFFAKSCNEENETNIVRNGAVLKVTDWDQYKISVVCQWRP